MYFMSQEEVNSIRTEYPEGCRVRLLHMDDPQAPDPGTGGTVQGVDDSGALMVRWDNGSGLHILFDAGDTVDKL